MTKNKPTIMNYSIKIIGFIILAMIALSVQAQEDSEELRKQRTETEAAFTKAVKGIPLAIPLWQESSPSLFLMPVCFTDSVRVIEKLYLVDATTNEFSYENDIYEVLEIRHYIDKIGYTALVKRISDKEVKEYEINSYMYRQIIHMNEGRWQDYNSRIKIPIIKK